MRYAPEMTRRTFAAAAVGGAAGLRLASAQDSQAANAGAGEDAPPPSPQEAAFERDYEPPAFRPSWSKAQINRTMAADFVIFAHSDLEKTLMLLDREPGLLNAAVDWGGGDWETALGGASHMGRKDIVELLLSRGARADLFCAAMLGQLPIVQGWIEQAPGLIDAAGPHGFTLHFHAQIGGPDAKPVLDYLQSIKQVDLKPLPPFLRK